MSIMKLKEIIKKIDVMIPKELGLENDNIGYFGPKFEDIDIKKIKVIMDLTIEEDNNSQKNELIISHHPPLFNPKTPTYVIHSNWDIINGGANDALAKKLNLNVLEVFDKETGIGRICEGSFNFKDFLDIIPKKLNIDYFRVVNPLNKQENNEKLKIAIISGFGLSNIDYIKLAKKNKVDILISGDLTHKGAILSKNLGICIVDISHYASEVPGLEELYDIISKIGIETKLIHQKIPWKYINSIDL